MKYVVLGIILAIIVALWGVYLLGKFLKVLTTEPPEEVKTPLAPHRCRGGGSLIQMRASAFPVGKRVKMDLPFPTTEGLHMRSFVRRENVSVFEGLYCASCGKRVVCGNCDNRHSENFTYDGREEHDSILKCCSNPVYVETNAPELHMTTPICGIAKA